MREEGSATEKHVRFPSSKALETSEQLVVDLLCAEIVDQVIVIDSNLDEGETV